MQGHFFCLERTVKKDHPPSSLMCLVLVKSCDMNQPRVLIVEIQDLPNAYLQMGGKINL